MMWSEFVVPLVKITLYSVAVVLKKDSTCVRM